VACLLGGIWSYTALHYHFKLSPGETVLVLNGEHRLNQVCSLVRVNCMAHTYRYTAGSAYGHIAVQLATSWGAKVIAAASSVEELNFLNDLRVTYVASPVHRSSPVALQAIILITGLTRITLYWWLRLDRVIDLTTENLVDAVMEETGGQGVDFLLETIPLTEHLSTTTAAGFHPFRHLFSNSHFAMLRHATSSQRRRSESGRCRRSSPRWCRPRHAVALPIPPGVISYVASPRWADGPPPPHNFR